MPYGIRLKKIMRVITRVPVGDYLIIILLGISSSLLEMDKLDCIRQTSPISATYKPCDLGKVLSILCFLGVKILQ